MLFIALIHLFWLLLTPVGLTFLILGLKSHKKWQPIVGAIILLLSLPAIFLCAQIWPLDFLLPSKAVRLPVIIGAYQITLVHFPDSDFYTTGFEVRRPDGKIARLLIDGDDNKWWFPHTLTTGARIYFLRDSNPVNDSTPYLDTADASLVPGCTARSGPMRFKISELDFNSPP